KVNEKWENELGLAFGRVIQEIRLGKVRREALRDMADRMDVPEMTSFVAAIIQSEQLGVSLSNVLGIQAEQMRIRRRQRAEEKAHQAPLKIIIAMGLITFPAICIVLMGPAVFLLINSALSGILF
ncbi:MAG: type II secretion system F family protein, partial [Chloroflexi bacterium]|nr:type II secretion system F family protein [Chloroflexota bacterium]